MHIHANSFARLFGKAATIAERPDATPHILRYTGASLTHKAGASIAESMARLGHTTPTMAMHYAKSLEGADADVAAALSKLAGGVR